MKISQGNKIAMILGVYPRCLQGSKVDIVLVHIGYPKILLLLMRQLRMFFKLHHHIVIVSSF
jgi:hypothetical protein